jgi:autotransporter translocation and assembly factor TamB
MEEGIGAAEAAGIIGGGLSGSFEETVTTLTGLDRVQLDPYVSRNSGEIAPRLTVSKRLVGEHLYVTYSYSLGNVPDEELRLEYRLSDQVSVTGGQDSYGSLGGDLKFRLRFQ